MIFKKFIYSNKNICMVTNLWELRSDLSWKDRASSIEEITQNSLNYLSHFKNGSRFPKNRSSRPEVFCKNVAKFTRKHLCQCVWHRYFPVNFAKFLTTTFLPQLCKISRPYLVSVWNSWTWTKSTPQKNWLFWWNPYRIEIVITSVIKMLELPSFGHMTKSTM